MSTTYTMVLDGVIVRGTLPINESLGGNGGKDLIDLLNADLKAQGHDVALSSRRFYYQPNANDNLATLNGLPPNYGQSGSLDDTNGGTSRVTMVLACNGVSVTYTNKTLTQINTLIQAATNLPFIDSEYYPSVNGNNVELQLIPPAISSPVTVTLTCVSGSFIWSDGQGIVTNFGAGDAAIQSILYVAKSYQSGEFGGVGPSAEYIPTETFISGSVREAYMPKRTSGITTISSYTPSNDIIDLNSMIRYPVTANAVTGDVTLGINRTREVPDLKYIDPKSRYLFDLPASSVNITDVDDVPHLIAVTGFSFDQVHTGDGRLPVKVFQFTVDTPMWVMFDQMEFYACDSPSNEGNYFLWGSADIGFTAPTRQTPEAVDYPYRDNNGPTGGSTRVGSWFYPGYYYRLVVSNNAAYGDLSDASFAYHTYATYNVS